MFKSFGSTNFGGAAICLFFIAIMLIDLASKEISTNWPIMLLISIILIVVIAIIEKLFLPELKAAK